MRILVIEDDELVSAFIKAGLSEHGHSVICADNGNDGLQMATTDQFDVIVMDRMLPGIDGMSILKNLRETNKNTPVLILSSMGNIDDKIEGLRGGGNDYLVKPFSFDELLVRVEILGRSTNQTQPNQTTFIKVEDMEIDLLTRVVKRQNVEIDVQAREFRLLEYLAKNRGKLITRTMLLKDVWDYNFDPQTNVVDVHISRLRSKVDKDFDQKLIQTVRGEGYIFG